MENSYKTALFIEKSTGKLLYKLKNKPLNKYFWEKDKVLVLEKISKDRFLSKTEIDIVEQ